MRGGERQGLPEVTPVCDRRRGPAAAPAARLFVLSAALAVRAAGVPGDGVRCVPRAGTRCLVRV
jgi:hypothetical protein